MQKNKIAVFGGTGKAGRYIVQELVKQSYPVRMLLRNSAAFTIQHPMIEIVSGDARNAPAVHETIAGCDIVISALGQSVMKRYSVRHLLSRMR